MLTPTPSCKVTSALEFKRDDSSILFVVAESVKDEAADTFVGDCSRLEFAWLSFIQVYSSSSDRMSIDASNILIS